MSLPGAVLPWVELRFLKTDATTGAAVPNASGTLTFSIAGTSTPKDTYTDSDLATPNANPLTLDSDGRPASPIFLASGGYKVVVKDSDGVQLYAFDHVEDVGLTFLATQANTATGGSKDVSTGYTVVAGSDYLVTLSSGESTNPSSITLPAASTVGQVIVIKNLAAVILNVTPDGSDTIEGIAGAYALPAAASPLFPTVRLLSDGSSNWWIDGGIGVG